MNKFLLFLRRGFKYFLSKIKIIVDNKNYFVFLINFDKSQEALMGRELGIQEDFLLRIIEIYYILFMYVFLREKRKLYIKLFMFWNVYKKCLNNFLL